MCRQPHTYAVDYFAVGVLAYEFMLGRVIIIIIFIFRIIIIIIFITKITKKFFLFL